MRSSNRTRHPSPRSSATGQLVSFGTRLISVGAFGLLATLLMIGAGPALGTSASQAGAQECLVVSAPSDQLTVIDGAQDLVVDVDLDSLTANAVAAGRVSALFEAGTRGWSADSIEQVATYFDDVAAWNDYMADPCTNAVSSAGSISVVPADTGAAYGFDSVFATVGDAVSITFSAPVEPEPTPSDAERLERLFATSDPAGPALAKSGSEAFVLVYFGAGLMAFGATALGMRRWMGPR